MTHPITHTLIYGDSGGGKSTGAATFPKPMLVMSFDPRGKETPYLLRGIAQPEEPDDLGTPCTDVVSRKTGELLIRVELYHDADPEEPEAYARFCKRMARLHHEYTAWKTVVCDSITFMELAARMREQFALNPRAKDPRQWYGGSKEALEQMLMIRFGALPLNVVVLAHVDFDKDDVHGLAIRNPMAPGKLRSALAAGYGELFHAYVKRLEGGAREYLWQTRSDNLHNAASQVSAPDPCPQVYDAIWSREENAS